MEKVKAQNMKHVFKVDVILLSIIFAGISVNSFLTSDITRISSLSGDASSYFLIPLPSKEVAELSSCILLQGTSASRVPSYRAL